MNHRFKFEFNLPSKQSIFLLDGIGGLITAFIIGFVLPFFREDVRLPKEILQGLAIAGLLYGIYSLSCSFFTGKRDRIRLMGIIGANVFYCIVTSVMVIMYLDHLSGWGITYFIAEIAIILALVGLEFKVLQQIPSR